VLSTGINIRAAREKLPTLEYRRGLTYTWP
jgi:hypothetical protein